VPDDKLESLMAELRAIKLCDRMRGKSVLKDGIDHAVGFEARRIRRLEIIGEIGVLLNKADQRSFDVDDQGRAPQFDTRFSPCRIPFGGGSP
jgi:hypothetical protein